MRALRKGCREHLSVSFTLKAWRDGKDGGGRQVEVNKEMAAMVREDMGAVPCEDDLGGGRGSRGAGCGREKLVSQVIKQGVESEIWGTDHTDMGDE